MHYPDERIAEVCKLGSIAAADLLECGRAGDSLALIGWTIRAAYKSLLSAGTPPAEALINVKTIVGMVNFTAKVNK